MRLEQGAQYFFVVLMCQPETPQTSCFVIILQRSSSMEGKKLELAKLAALHVVENLPRGDALGVLAFADTAEWAAPVHKTADRTSLMMRSNQ